MLPKFFSLNYFNKLAFKNFKKLKLKLIANNCTVYSIIYYKQPYNLRIKLSKIFLIIRYLFKTLLKYFLLSKLLKNLSFY